MNMKWIVKTICITALIIGLMLLFSYQQTHYIRIGHVSLVHQFGVYNRYEFVDSTRNKYQFYSTDLISPYDTIKVTMHNNRTDSDVTDDMVVNYKIVPDSENEKEK